MNTSRLAFLALALASASAYAQVKFTPLPDFGFGGGAYRRNVAGTIVGCAVTDASFKLEPVVWSSETSVPSVLPTNGLGGFATGLNANGLVVGQVFFMAGAGGDPAVWRDGQLELLPTLGEGGTATDVNDAGQVVGYVVQGGLNRAALWQDGALQVLDAPVIGNAGDKLESFANGINFLGEVSGYTRVSFGSDSLALKWQSGAATPSRLPEWLETKGLGVTDSSAVFVSGYFSPNGSQGLALYNADGTAKVFTAPTDSFAVWGVAASSNGLATGYYRAYGDEPAYPGILRAAVWADGVPQQLELPSGYAWALPVGVTPDGTVVGSISDGVSGRSVPGTWSLGIDYVMLTNTTAYVGQETTLTARAMNRKKPLAGRKIVFQLNGTKVGEASTDATGYARLRYTVPASMGTGSTVMASLGGGKYALAKFSVQKQLTEFAMSQAKNKQAGSSLVTTVLRNKVTRLPIAKAPVTVVIGGKAVSGVTDTQGRFVTTVKTPTAPTSVELRFTGSSTHQSAVMRGVIR
jgi:hypothetical protein